MKLKVKPPGLSIRGQPRRPLLGEGVFGGVGVGVGGVGMTVAGAGMGGVNPSFSHIPMSPLPTGMPTHPPPPQAGGYPPGGPPPPSDSISASTPGSGSVSGNQEHAALAPGEFSLPRPVAPLKPSAEGGESDTTSLGGGGGGGGGWFGAYR